VIEEIVQMIWGKLRGARLSHSPLARFQRLHDFFRPITRLQNVHAVVRDRIFVALLLVLTRTRVGLIIQASLTHPHMVGMLGITCRASSCWCSACGCGGSRRSPGVIAGPALVTQSNMAALLGPIPVRRRRQSAALLALSGAFIAFAPDRSPADLRRGGQSFDR